jgi:hypothetical protein
MDGIIKMTGHHGNAGHVSCATYLCDLLQNFIGIWIQERIAIVNRPVSE